MQNDFTLHFKVVRLFLGITTTQFGLMFCGPGMAADHHPLDPLDKDELQATVDLIKVSGKLTESSRFSLISLHEPPKEVVSDSKPGGELHREALAIVYDRAANRTSEAIVDVQNRRLLSWQDVPGVQPSALEEDDEILRAVVRADPRWKEAMRKRGITDFDNIDIDSGPTGYFGRPENDGRRVRIAVCAYHGSPKNYVGRTIEGVVAYVDLNSKKVIKFIDTGVVPLPPGTPGFDDQSVGKTRQAPEPLQVNQPHGASFEVHGHEVRWQKWHFRFGMNPREGLVLYTVGYEDQGRLRSILYRASLSEMVVPYGDPGPGWYTRNFFDEGEDSMGRYADSLESGSDAPPYAQFFDAVFADEKGVPFEVPRAVALYERDGGLLWKHYDRDRKHNASRRARQLVLGWIATVGNYEYGFNWVFDQDGSLETEVILTGYMETKAIELTKTGDHDAGALYGHLIAPQIIAVNHQHFFNFRLDTDIDGAKPNTVAELNTETVGAGPQNPEHNAFMMKETLLPTELQARRNVDLASNRSWKVFNPNVKNSLGDPVGYLLVPEDNSVPYAAPDSWFRKRASFVNYHLWVTPYDGNQIFAAGQYVTQSKGDDGLANWTAQDRSIEGQDVVLWYTLAVTHLPRPEEWPVMDVRRAGFKLVPCGFFDRNPALDVPKP
jgi:primary-amine oxidase